jgi:hypothetical protein
MQFNAHPVKWQNGTIEETGQGIQIAYIQLPNAGRNKTPISGYLSYTTIRLNSARVEKIFSGSW